MTIDEARRKIIVNVEPIYDKEEAQKIAELLMEYITRLPMIERILKKNEELIDPQKELLSQSIHRLQNHEPIQYIMNESWFAGMKFFVNESVLIPRPETEELVEWVISDYKLENPDWQSNPVHKLSSSRFIDIGTGSGCIAISLKTKLPHIEMWACDISVDALNVARMNADSLNATIDFVPLNFLDSNQRRQLPQIDLIISNPPYVLQQDRNEMRKNVTDFEPAQALFVPENDPLIFYSAIADFGHEKLNDGGKIYVEIHENLASQVKNLFQQKGFNHVEIKKDLQEKERMIKAFHKS